MNSTPATSSESAPDSEELLHPWQIGRKGHKHNVTVLVLLTSVTLACIIAAVDVWTCHRAQLVTYSQNHSQALRAFATPLVHSLERKDDQQAQLLLDSMTITLGVDQVVLERDNHVNLVSGAKIFNSAYVTEYPLNSAETGNGVGVIESLGRVTLAADSTLHHAYMRSQILNSFALNIARFVLVAVLGLFLFRLFVGRHLALLANHAKHGDTPLILPKTFGIAPLHGLQHVATAMNHAHESSLEERTLAQRHKHATQHELNSLRTEVATQKPLASLGQQLGTIAHEIRNPLAALRASSQTLKLRLLPRHPDLKALLQRIDNSADRCARIVDMTRDMAKNAHTASDVTNLVTWLEQYTVNVEHPASISLQLTTQDEAVYADVDTFKLTQILNNLVENAVHATLQNALPEPSESSLPNRINIMLSDLSADTIALDVIDAGSGLVASQHEKALEPFYTTKSSGMGLGLAISSQLAKALGGHLSLAACPNGTRARITLPRVNAPSR